MIIKSKQFAVGPTIHIHHMSIIWCIMARLLYPNNRFTGWGFSSLPPAFTRVSFQIFNVFFLSFWLQFKLFLAGQHAPELTMVIGAEFRNVPSIHSLLCPFAPLLFLASPFPFPQTQLYVVLRGKLPMQGIRAGTVISNVFVVCPIAVAYSMGQIINSLCLVRVSVCPHYQWLIFIDFCQKWHRGNNPTK